MKAPEDEAREILPKVVGLVTALDSISDAADSLLQDLVTNHDPADVMAVMSGMVVRVCHSHDAVTGAPLGTFLRAYLQRVGLAAQ